MGKQHGNGSSKFKVITTDMGGWIRVVADPSAVIPPDLPLFHTHSLSNWFRDHPQFHLVSVIPIDKDGATIELHAFYGQHVFPDISKLGMKG